MTKLFATKPFARIFLVLACMSMPLLGLAETVSEELTRIEQHVFAVGFDNEPLESRVKRLEMHVYGADQSGDVTTRQARLAQVFKPLMEAPSQSQPPTSSYETPETPAETPPPKNTDATDYPAVTALERVVFSRDFIYDDVETRIARLERRTFNQEYAHLALVDRLDRLQARYPHARPDDRVLGSGGDASAIDSLPSSSRQFVGSGDVYAKLDALEGALMPSQRNGHLLITERLDKLEQVAFGYAHSGESVDARLNRLLQGYQSRYAKPSYNQQSYNPINPPPRLNSTYRPNIQVGSGIYSSSQTSTGGGFSDEMISMLPNDVRQQVGGMPSQQYDSRTSYNNGWGTTTQQSSTTVFGAPGTTITEERTVLPPPGYYPTQPGVTYQSYTTTVDQFGNRVRTPTAYSGNPVVSQQLADLEIRVFGQVNTADIVPIRFMRLENKVLGQTYGGYADQDRISNISKALQYQSLGKTLGTGKAADIGRTAGSVILGIPLTPPGQ